MSEKPMNDKKLQKLVRHLREQSAVPANAYLADLLSDASLAITDLVYTVERMETNSHE